MLLDDEAEELRLAHRCLHHRSRLLLAFGDRAGLVELGRDAVDGHDGLFRPLVLQLGDPRADAVICC